MSSFRPNLTTLGAVLRALRLERGMTQERLALRAKLTPALISDSERGLRNLSFQSLERWLAALDVDWAQFGTALAREAAQGDEQAEDPGSGDPKPSV